MNTNMEHMETSASAPAVNPRHESNVQPLGKRIHSLEVEQQQILEAREAIANMQTTYGIVEDGLPLEIVAKSKEPLERIQQQLADLRREKELHQKQGSSILKKIRHCFLSL